jgi:pyruvate,orthophosphate dikinase
MTINDNTKIDRFVKALYPSLIIHELTREFCIQSAPASGISSARSLYHDKVPEESGIVLTEKIPPKLLGFLHRISAFITREEDPSSHTSIVCRSQGIPIVNVTQSNFEQLLKISQHVNEDIAIDTFQGKIFIGKIQLEDNGVISSRQKILKLIKSTTKLDVNANSDTDLELKRAVNLGFQHAWPRSETLLYAPSIYPFFVAFLLSPSHEYARRQFIEGNINEIKKLFNEANGTRIAFRLLDPPSHEFFPALDDAVEIQKISNILGTSEEEICMQIREHTEINPMIGHRGARLLLSNLAILHAQAFSMFSAWKMADPKLRPPYVEILVPFVMLPSEFKSIKEYILSLQSTTAEWIDIPVKYGCMVEVPSILDYPCELAPEVDFFSFGTNDLVSLMYGISRGDAYDRYLSNYLKEKIIDTDPFSIIPPKIIDKIQEFCLKAKSVNPHLKVDICGEQALHTNLFTLLESGALDAVSIGTENLPILVKSLIQSGILTISESV